MYITHTDYHGLGYRAVPEQEFTRYNMMAEATVRKLTQDRIGDMSSPDDGSESARVAKMNRCGLCEIIDIYYCANNPRSEAAKERQIVTGYSNDGYSESYLGEARSDAGIAAPERLGIREIMSTYFTPDQIYRGVG